MDKVIDEFDCPFCGNIILYAVAVDGKEGKPTEGKKGNDGKRPGRSLLGSSANGNQEAPSNPVDAVAKESKKLKAKVLRLLKAGKLTSAQYKRLIFHAKTVVRTRSMTWDKGESLFSVLKRADLPPDWYYAALWEKEAKK